MDRGPVVHVNLPLSLGEKKKPFLLLLQNLKEKTRERGKTSNPEALSFAIDVAQTQVNVCADALHRLYGQGTPQVVGVGPGRGQAEAKPAGQRRRGRVSVSQLAENGVFVRKESGKRLRMNRSGFGYKFNFNCAPPILPALP